MNTNKTKKFSDEEMQSILLEYFNKQIRPYSINDILNNLYLTSKKTQVAKNLELLTEEGKLYSKKIGKSTIWTFAYDPKNNEEGRGGNLIDYEVQLKIISDELVTLELEKNNLEEFLIEFKSYVLDEYELQDNIESLNKTIESYKIKLQDLKSKSEKLKNKNNNENGKPDHGNVLIEKIQKSQKVFKKCLNFEKILKNSILTIVPTIKKTDLNKYILDEVGCDEVFLVNL
ncbi:hypothetical protein ACO0SA_003993 [Hanseniaspora valbyensis]